MVLELGGRSADIPFVFWSSVVMVHACRYSIVVSGRCRLRSTSCFRMSKMQVSVDVCMFGSREEIVEVIPIPELAARLSRRPIFRRPSRFG